MARKTKGTNSKTLLDSYVTSTRHMEWLWGLVEKNSSKSKSQYLRDLIEREAKAEGLAE